MISLDFKAQSNLNHLVGIDIGYNERSTIVGAKGEVNLNYVFNPRYFCIKAQVGIAPTTNFGILKKGFFSAGFSTKIDKLVSWHLLAGVANVVPSNKYRVEYSNGSHTTYTFSVFSFLLETGFYIRPKENKRVVFGINSVVHRYMIDGGDKYPVVNDQLMLNVNFSVNLLLNRSKKETK